MKRVKLILTASALAVIAVLANGVAAQETNTSERTFLTFSGTVEMPGVTLEPGTYVFKLANTETSRNVVQVWDRDEKNILGQWLFVQAERPQVSGDNVVMFKEAREGSTPAVQFWYFPGEKVGKEFVYPKEQATKIAARTGIDVRSDEGVIEGSGVPPVTASADTAANPAPAAAAQVQAESERPAPEPAPAPAAAAPQASVASPSPAAESPRAVGTSGQAARAELPQTASPLALSGLIALLTLAGAMGIRAVRQ